MTYRPVGYAAGKKRDCKVYVFQTQSRRCRLALVTWFSHNGLWASGMSTLLNCTLPSQNVLYRNKLNRTLINQKTAKPYSAKSYSTKPYFAKQESTKSQIWNLLNRTLLNHVRADWMVH